jgi:hypothetical protein
VRVGEELLAQRVLAHLGAPHLGVAHEEALVAGEAADHGAGLPPSDRR